MQLGYLREATFNYVDNVNKWGEKNWMQMAVGWKFIKDDTTLQPQNGAMGLLCIPPNNFGPRYIESRGVLVSFVEQTGFNFGSILFFFFQ